MAGAGYTPDAIDAMPMADVAALFEHWRAFPPVHEILAAEYGIRPPPRRDPDDPSNIGELIGRRAQGDVKR